MKTKKPSIRLLKKDLERLQEELSLVRNRNLEYHRENQELKTKLQARLDDRMLEQRNKLASNLGQMIDATSQAIKFIIGKEVL